MGERGEDRGGRGEVGMGEWGEERGEMGEWEGERRLEGEREEGRREWEAQLETYFTTTINWFHETDRYHQSIVTQ